MNTQDRLKEIDNFFEKLDMVEFEQMLEKAGMDEIESSAVKGMELSLSLDNTYDNKSSSLYLGKKDRIKSTDNYYNYYSKEYIKAG